MSISLEGIFVPQTVRRKILGEDLEGPLFRVFSEQPLCSVMRLIVKIGESAIRSFEREQLVDFDANPGDRACQLQAIKLRVLFLSTAIREELAPFKAQIADLKGKVQKRASLNSNLKAADLPRAEFFKTHVASIEVTEGLAYLLRCRMLKITRVTNKVLENGIIITKTDVNQLMKVERALSFDHGEAIASHVAADLSGHSIRVIQGIAQELSLPDPEKASIQQMLAVTRQNEAPIGIPAKSFSCLFFQMKALLSHLKEERATLMIKSIVKEGAPESFFLRFEGGEFVVSKQKPALETPLVVFHAVILDRAALLKLLDSEGFTELMLMYAASEEPFEPGSTIDHIPEEGRGEVAAYRERAAALPKAMIQDHVFCTLMKDEEVADVSST
jgi:hypothetical protein